MAPESLGQQDQVSRDTQLAVLTTGALFVLWRARVFATQVVACKQDGDTTQGKPKFIQIYGENDSWI